MKEMDWNDLQSFLAIAETGSLSAAARNLGVTQPTMGRRLQSMQMRLGVALLLRTSTGYALTPAGEAVLEKTRKIAGHVDAVALTLSGEDQNLRGVVRITTVDTLAEHIVVPAAASLLRHHPELTIEITPAAQTLNLSRREADIAVRPVSFTGNNIVTRKVGELRHGLFANAQWARKYPTIHDWPRNGPVITVMEDQDHLPQVQWFHNHFDLQGIVMRSNDRTVQARAAAQGIGIACLPYLDTPISDGLVPISSDPEPDILPIYLGVHTDLRKSARIRATMDAIIAICQKRL